jgi:hypothetical protein
MSGGETPEIEKTIINNCFSLQNTYNPKQFTNKLSIMENEIIVPSPEAMTNFGKELAKKHKILLLYGEL